MNNHHEIVTNHFEKLADVYDICISTKRISYLKTVDNIIIEKLKNRIELNILDIGCATGTRILKLNDVLHFKKISSCDVSEKMVKKAIENGLKDTKICSFLDLPYDNESFDCVFCLFNVLGYTNNNQELSRVFKEIYRVLKQEGLFIFDIMNYWHLGEGLAFKNSIKSIIINSFKSVITGKSYKSKTFYLNMNDDKLPGYVRGFTKKEIDVLANMLNFEIDTFKIIGYDSGGIKDKIIEGNFMYILKKG